MGRLVWAFEPLEETGGETGFVDIEDEAVAEKLIDQGRVQCGWEPDGGEFKHIDGKAVAAYATRQLKAGGTRTPPPPKKAADAPDEDAGEGAKADADAKPKAKSGKAK